MMSPSINAGSQVSHCAACFFLEVKGPIEIEFHMEHALD